MSIYFGNFRPDKVTNTQLYIQRKDSTVSLCPDYSVNGYDFTQGVALQQPTLGVDSIDFTTNDFMINNTANVFSGDNSGYIFFSGYFNSASANYILASNDLATNNDFITILINASGQFQSNFREGTTNNIIVGNTILTNGQYYHGWIRSNGSVTTAKLNGVSQTLTVISGSNNGFWFNDISNRDNLVIGAQIRSTPLYGSAQINKVHYVSGSPTAIDIWKIEQFMSNPLNYI